MKQKPTGLYIVTLVDWDPNVNYHQVKSCQQPDHWNCSADIGRSQGACVKMPHPQSKIEWIFKEKNWLCWDVWSFSKGTLFSLKEVPRCWREIKFWGRRRKKVNFS